MNLDHRFGTQRRANATIPLATMVVSLTSLRIGPIGVLRRILPTVDIPRSQVVAAYRSIGLVTFGVAVRTNTSIHYFWTFRIRRILNEIEALGYPIEGPRWTSMFQLLGRSSR
jgi:hypothetical protein